MSEESKSWYLMTRPLFNSGFEDDELALYGQDGFQEVLDSALGSDVLIYEKTLSVEPTEVRAIVENETSDVYNSTTVRQILCNLGTLRCGQYVVHKGLYWMVSALPDDNRIYEKAVLWKCKHSIRFISPVTGDIVEYPVYSVNSTQYGTGEQRRTNITIGEDQHLIYIPYNEETIRLDDRFRFIMDKNKENPTVYRITRVDPVTYAVGGELFDDGLIQWSVLETQFNEETDSREEMVADYYSSRSGWSESGPGETATITIKDLDEDYMLAIGEEKTLRIKCVMPDGTEVNPFDYRVEPDLADGAADIVSVDGDEIVLRAAHNSKYVGQTISIRVVSDVFETDATIMIQIVNW